MDRFCNMGMYPYQPMMPIGNQIPKEATNIQERLNNIEKRLSILEANLNNQNLTNNMMNNYQML